MPQQATLRDRAGVSELFAGLELVPPGLVRLTEWRPESELQAASPAALWAGVARKPPAGSRPVPPAAGDQARR